MTRKINRLSARSVSTATKPGLLADGGGLYLQVGSVGTKSWIFRYTGDKVDKDGNPKRGLKDMGIGPLHTISLSEARELATDCRKQVRDGIDPIEWRKALKLSEQLDSAKAMTFEQCALAFIDAHKAGWKNAKHIDQWRNTLIQYVYPIVGKLPVSAVDTGLVLKVIEPIWATKTETASRIRGRIENILDWAKVRNYREGENPARWRGHLDKTLPKQSKVQKITHHSALPYENLGSFMVNLRKITGISASGLEFLILTATRTGEVIGAKWNEIDLDNAIWIIPAERMKAEKEHRVPLSERAVLILKNLPRIVGSDYVFPGRGRGRPLSNMAFLQLLKRMGRSDITAHGFRSTFRDWAAEQTAFPREVLEHALAHLLKDKAEAAYQRRDLFDKRRQLMGAWSDYCAVEGNLDGNVTLIRGNM